MCLDDGLRTTVTAQFIEVVKCRFGARQDDDIGFKDVIYVVRIEQMDAGILLQGVEIGLVGEVLQHDNGYIDLALLHLE